MITKRSALVVLIGALLSASALAAVSGVQKPAVTVGDFAVKLTKALGKPATDQRAAAEALKSLGVKVGNDLGAGLTEGVAARILGELGLRTTAIRAADQHPAADPVPGGKGSRAVHQLLPRRARRTGHRGQQRLHGFLPRRAATREVEPG